MEVTLLNTKGHQPRLTIRSESSERSTAPGKSGFKPSALMIFLILLIETIFEGGISIDIDRPFLFFGLKPGFNRALFIARGFSPEEMG